MISVVIPTLNAEARLAACLDALISATMAGLIREVIVVDGGSGDATLKIADGFGARVMNSPAGRGGQLKAGADAARGDWLLFLHADTVLDALWMHEARALMEEGKRAAAVFTLAFSGGDWRGRVVAFGAMQRTRWLKAPYGDQGLLIKKSLYDELGGYRDMPLFEDVELIDRLTARQPFDVFKAKAVTSPARYERDGYFRRVLGNLMLTVRYRMGEEPEALARRYR